MRGVTYLCPLLGTGGTDAAVAQEHGVHVTPAFANERAMRTAADTADPARLQVILDHARQQSELLAQEPMPAMPEECWRAMPLWAQRVVQTECLGQLMQASVLPPSSNNQDSSSGDLARANERIGSKRRRPVSENEEGSRFTASSESLEVVDATTESSQGTEAGAEDVDMGNSRVLLTQEKRLATNVEKYSEVIERMVATSKHRMQSDAIQRDGADLLMTNDVKLLMQTLKVMNKNALIAKCAPEMVIEFISYLDVQVQIGLRLDILGTFVLNQGDEEWQGSGIDIRLMSRVQSSLEVGIGELLIMSTPAIDRRVLSEEIMDNCIQLISDVVRRLVLPCIDPTAATTVIASYAASAVSHTQNDAGGETKEAGCEEQQSASESSKTTRALNSAMALHFNVKKNKDIFHAVNRIIPVVCEFIEQLARLASVMNLPDRWILHFSSMLSGLFELPHSAFANVLQRSGLILLRTITRRYPAHRTLILDEMLSVMMKLPTGKRNLRTVKLTGSINSVQMITTVVVALVQACAYAETVLPAKDTSSEDPTQLSGDESQTTRETDVFSTGIRQVRGIAKEFIASLLKQCMKKSDDRDNRVVLDNFVEDLLVMFVRPEWTGAEILLEALSSSLAGILNSNLSKDAKKLESQYSIMALQLVGRICVAIKLNRNAAIQDALDDEDCQSVYDDHKSFVLECVKHDNVQESRENEHTRQLVLKHMALSYVHRNMLDTTHSDSKRILISKFILDVYDVESGTAAGSKYDQEDAIVLWKSYWDLSGRAIGSASKVAIPSIELGLRVSLQLAVSREFCSLFDKLLMHLMALLSRGIPTFRSRVMKSLSGIVDVDPMLMADPGVHAAVCRCFLDEAISVRQAAVDLVGKYVTLQPVLFGQYYDMLVERLRDKGISVRKSVCRIFREYLTIPHIGGDKDDAKKLEDKLRRRSSCMRNMVERIGDATEDDVVKNFIIDTFQEVWFGSDLASRQLLGAIGFGDENNERIGLPPGWSAVPSTATALSSAEDQMPKSQKHRRNRIEFMSPDGNIVSSIEEAWTAYRKPMITPSSVVKSNRSKIDDTLETVATIIEVIYDMTTVDWIVALFNRLLHDDDGIKTTHRRASRDRANDVTVARLRSEKIVSCLIECLIQLEEGNQVRGLMVAGREAQFLSCVKALGAFAHASADLIAPHLEVLMVYLKGDDSLTKAVEWKVQSEIVDMVRNVINYPESRISKRICSLLEEDLRTLIFRAPPSVVGPSIKCLAALVSNTRQSPVLLFKLLDTFYGYLVKFQHVDSLDNIKPESSSSLQRALFAAGQIGGVIDLDAVDLADIPVGSTLSKGSIMASLFDMYISYLKLHEKAACIVKAVQGLGFLFLLRPRLLLQAQQQGLLEKLLRNSPNELVKLQCLTSLKEVLQHEELRQERKGGAAKNMNKELSKNQQVEGDQEGEASVISGVMQAQLKNILALTLVKNVRIRSEAVACITVLLTQGLVSPVHCVPNLVALETDQVVPIRDTAHAHLVALHNKFPTLLHMPSIQGLFLSHIFQTRVFGTCSVFALDKDKKEYCLFGRLYSRCLRVQRAQRNMLLKSMINQFSDQGNILTTANLNLNPLRTVDYLSYIAHAVMALPYDVEDEPLYIIYLINRYVTLKLGSLLRDLKKGFALLGVEPRKIINDEYDVVALDICEYLDDEYDDEQLKHTLERCCIGYALHLLIRIKFFLKDMYLLDNEKCQTYRPGIATKANDQPVLVATSHMKHLQLPSSNELQADHPLEFAWNLFTHTWQAAQEDQNQLDFDCLDDVSRTTRRRGRRRKSTAKAQPDDEHLDEDELVVGFDG